MSLWSQCALTDHLLITRDWAPVSSPGSRAELTGRAQAQLPRSDRACRFWSRAREAQCSQASEISSRHNKLDFSSFREKLRPGESSERYAHVTKTDRDSRLTSGDIGSHLSSWDFSEMTDEGRILSNISTMPLPIYQSFKPEQRPIVSKKLSALRTESIHPDAHATRDSSDLTRCNVNCHTLDDPAVLVFYNYYRMI